MDREIQTALEAARNGRRAYAKFTLLGIAARAGIDRQTARELSVEHLAALIQGRETRTVNGVTFYAVPEQGAWYEVPSGPVGSLYAPMLADGSFDPDDIAEIEVAYDEA